MVYVRHTSVHECYAAGSISLKHAHIEIGGTVPKNAPTKFIFKLVTADRSSYFCVQCV